VTAGRCGTKSSTLCHLDASKLVELLRQSAVEHLTACRQLQAPEFGSFASVVTPDFKALYAYKRGEYQRCLHLSVHAVRNMIAGVDSTTLLPVYLYPELVQLVDDDLVSLIGLVTLVHRPLKRNSPPVIIYPLSLLLHLMTRCQIRLRHSVTSLARTLDYVQFARDRIIENTECRYSIDQLVLKVAGKILSRYYLY